MAKLWQIYPYILSVEFYKLVLLFMTPGSYIVSVASYTLVLTFLTHRLMSWEDLWAFALDRAKTSPDITVYSISSFLYTGFNISDPWGDVIGRSLGVCIGQRQN